MVSWFWQRPGARSSWCDPAVLGMPRVVSVNLMGNVLVGVFEIAVAANFYRSTAVARFTEV